MDYVAYRHLVGVCYTEEEAKALAEEVCEAGRLGPKGLGFPLMVAWQGCNGLLGGRWRSRMAPMKMGRCSCDQESCLITSLNHTQILRPPEPPTMEPCLLISAISCELGTWTREGEERRV